jgi:hypothetical protein
MAKSGNLFKRAAEYRKKHKNLTQAEAVKVVSKMSGPVKTKLSGRKKVAGTKRKIVRRKRVGDLPVALMGRTTRKKSAIGSIAKTERLLREIDTLEAKRQRAKKKELRDIIQLEINARHDKVDQVRRAYRR